MKLKSKTSNTKTTRRLQRTAGEKDIIQIKQMSRTCLLILGGFMFQSHGYHGVLFFKLAPLISLLSIHRVVDEHVYSEKINSNYFITNHVETFIVSC